MKSRVGISKVDIPNTTFAFGSTHSLSLTQTFNTCFFLMFVFVDFEVVYLLLLIDSLNSMGYYFIILEWIN